MDSLILLGLLAAALLIVGPILGTIAFFRVRTLNRELEELRTVVASSRGRPSAPASVPSIRREQDEPAPESAPEVPESAPEPEPDTEASPPAVEDAEPPIAASTDASASRYDDFRRARDAVSDFASGTGGNRLEEMVGARWAVWVGGIALALGAVFLVRYSFEQGLLGPRARILLGLLFSLALGATGEWTRRRGAAFSVGGFESANVPSILTAAGTLGAFASIYAAYQLYGFLGPAAAFIALGIVSVATMAAALLHGPLLAALGIVGSFLVPFLVSTDEPSTAGLAVYAFAVSVAAFGVGRMRLWRWLAIIAALGLVFFGAVLFLVASSGERPVLGIYILAAWAAIFYVFVASLYERSVSEFVAMDKVAAAVLSLVLLLGLGFIAAETDTATVVGLALLILVPFASAHYYAAIRYIVPVAAIVTVIGYSSWELTADTWEPIANSFDTLEQIDPAFLPGYQQKLLSLFGALGIGLALLAGGLGLLGAMRSAARVPLAFGGAFVPVLILGVSYARTDFLGLSVRYGVIALVLCVAFYAIAIYADRRLSDANNGREGVTASYLIAALSALALGLCMLLERGALTVALALMTPATAYIYSQRPFKALRPLTLVPAILWAARIAWDPAIVGSSLGTTPIFNWLLYGYGVPAAGFVLAAWLLGKNGRDRWLEAMEGIAVASVTAAIAVVGLHALDPDEVFTYIDTLSEAAFLVLVGGGVALGLLRLKRTTDSSTLSTAANILGFAGMAAAVLGLLGIYNPFLTGEAVGGGAIFNKLFFAYLMTGLLYSALGFFGGRFTPAYSRTAYAVGGLMLFAWVTLSIRHWFHPVSLDIGPTSDAELYTYSAAWLAIGIAVLAAGMTTGVRALRLLSGAIIVAVVAKVFVVDMSNLTGFLRALSFIGLGGVLVAIGLVYQRLLRRQA
ncbi:DUF2339 domain-containing protein [Hoeflea sp. TYP-13]|uniref:DUF2339 domain-containing protein n=1 Tax=Hoeflea sp. TYP-13 TaxID=3230023 RepID=UPI0034C66995